ncbi:MAG TPA: MATE family efflux transporter [Alphaproteobacteria bacterium]|nr:MATE family efflux transporter [Alphaproteobacteria bacterium]
MQSPALSKEWHRRVWRLAGPIILSNITVPLMGAVDTAVMGQLPDAKYIGGVALAATVFAFLYWSFGFLRLGTTGIVAQAFGARDDVEVFASLIRPLLIAVSAGVMLVALQAPLARVSFWLLDGSPASTALAKQYYAVRIWGAPAALANYVLWGWLLGVQRAREAFVLQLALNSVNMALAILFVIGFGWGVSGVASATLISEWLSVAAGLSVTLVVVRRIETGTLLGWRRILDRDRLAALFHVNGNIFLRTLCLILAFSYFTARSARMGDLVLAANAVLMQFQQLMGYGLDGFAFTASALVGEAFGARDPVKFRNAIAVTTFWSGLVAVLCVMGYAAFGGAMIDLLTGQEPVREVAEHYLPWMVASPLVSFWAFQLDGIFIGATAGKEMRNAMAVSLVVCVGAVWMFVPLWNNHGLWLSLMIFMAARGATLGFYFPRLARRLPLAELPASRFVFR